MKDHNGQLIRPQAVAAADDKIADVLQTVVGVIRLQSVGESQNVRRAQKAVRAVAIHRRSTDALVQSSVQCSP